MRVKVRFNSEAGQPPVVLDLRFLPRIGERIELGFRRVIEVLEVHRVDDDNRFGGIVRAKYIHLERRPPPPMPPPMPMPMPPVNLPGLGAPIKTGTAAVYGDVNLNELQATVQPPATVPDPTH
ncbi:MAG TPA: hypothetical protein VFC26_05305 [Verrucomicrobiae bacterium]|jgi:hypothetical protein|nr:hypothetical protein [Verrucomicrobiae bacterium]